MENVLTAVIIFFILIFGIFTFSDALITSQDVLGTARIEMETRLYTQTRTHLNLIDAYTQDMGTTIELIILNDGDVRLIDFEEWDVIIHYLDNAALPIYHVAWFPYVDSDPLVEEWAIVGLYSDASQMVGEFFEPNVLNPDEELILQIKPGIVIQEGSLIQASLTTSGGSSHSTSFTSNYVPVLDVNTNVTIAASSTKIIDSTVLHVTDLDDTPQTLIYTVTTAPNQGSLTPISDFTQQDITDGLLAYVHSGSGDDQFQFTVTDGKDTIGIYTFNILISTPPVLQNNNDLLITGSGAYTVSSTLLQVTDVDNTPADLVYTITYPPVQGSLNLSSSFTQDDINSGLLIYTHTGAGNDSFQFTVTDGENIIGAYIFYIIY